MDKQIIEAVTNLNEAFFESETPVDFMGFEYRGNGYWDAVFFMGVRIWTDNDETRTFDEDYNEYEPFFNCFKREALSILEKLTKTKRHLTTAST